MKRPLILLTALFVFFTLGAANTIHIDDPEHWTANDLLPYVGQTVTFDADWYLTANYNGNYKVSPRRIYSPTNQEIPLSTEYYSLVSLNNTGTVNINGINGYHRTGERLHNLTVRVNSTSSLTLQSCTWVGNSRSDLRKGINMEDIGFNGEHTILVCGMNLRYYLAENFGTGYGPDNAKQHQTQRTKVSKVLSMINADIYGLVEVEQGPAAVQEIADDLTRLTGRPYTFINFGEGSSGSYTKSCYIYCSATVTPVGNFKYTNSGVKYRKYMQAFRENASGEVFIYSINHFKSKSGGNNASGADADQGDGQGAYNASRVQEAQAVLNLYKTMMQTVNDSDLLLMGDLNAYGKEDPIRTLTDGGLTDLHRYFHADSSYSYTYWNEAGYLDHAIASGKMLRQITGMTVFHVNSDELEDYAYQYGDTSMFRCSDHDPVIVGLRLDSHSTNLTVNTADVLWYGSDLTIRNAEGGHLRIYDIWGRLIYDQLIPNSSFCFSTAQLPQGLYILHIFYNGGLIQEKMLVP
ncbi:MAG: endonuclease/exonuclease/phosphatase family protein [Paludibacteraceae bacterium]|nr:endonuclease/exonuclease/phosphatase family protein [Paludibacteraceae bacterium]